MKIAGIDFPGRLLDALRDDKLVVFAGAGVSMGGPACLPSFRELAEAIAQGTGELLGAAEPETRFLDRLYINGVEVHTIAAQALSGADLEPTDLHRSLLRLYPRVNSTRIVTTNFDLLFEHAAEDVFGSQPEAFKAPALPQGDKFNGIVHVHGSVDRSEEMVLTDADFGKAYLTDGSARRFLVDLFNSFTILFVGYSHEDVVMRYLGGALRESAQGNRFVFTHETDDSKWQLLGIKPVLYEKSPEGNHTALQEGIDGLADYASRGILDWQRDIAEIAGSAPSLDEEAMDLVNDALSDPMRARFFTEAALDPRWVRWLEIHGHLDTLFVPTDQQLTEPHARLAGWLARTFVSDQSGVLFLLVQRKGMRLHRAFWWELGRAVGSDRQPPLDRDVLARWVSLLLETMGPFPDEYVLSWLGDRSADAELMGSLLDVFDAMIVNRLMLKPDLAIPSDGGAFPITADFKPRSDGYAAKQLWERQLRTRLDQIAEPLLTDAVHKLIRQHRLLRSWQPVDSTWDITSLLRTAIEPLEQDRYHQALDVLIDAARDSLQHLAASEPEIAAQWSDQLIRASAPLLRRLAVHAVSFRKDLTADDRIDWILDTIGLHDRQAAREIRQAVGIAYRNANRESRRRVIDAVRAYTSPDEEDADRELRTADRQLAWLDRLLDSDPSCELARQSREALLNQYPALQPKTYSEPPQHWSAEQLLSRPATEWLKDLLEGGQGDSIRSDRDRIALAVEEASTQSFDWGIDLADALVEAGQWDSDLGPVLLRVWSREMDEDKHRRVLERLANAELHSRHTSAVANLLYELVKNGGLPYAARLLPVANQLAATLWAVLDPSERLFEMDDWLYRAINHPAGTLTGFWIHSLALKRQQQDPKPRTFDDEYASAFCEMIGDETVAGTLVKTVLAKYLGFILAADEDWAKKYLLPLFENPDDEAYRPVWHGVLYATLNARIADALEDAFPEAMYRIETLFPTELRRQFVAYYAFMAIYSVDEPLKSWIPQFFANASEQDKHDLAWNMGNYLRDMDDAKRRDLWERWLRDYWKSRLQGIPGPLTVAEIPSMLGWVPNLTTFFPEAVEYAIKMPKTSFKGTLILHDLNEGDAWSKYPGATVMLLIYMADCEPPPWVWHEAEEIIKKLRGLDLPEELDTQLRELAVRLNLP